MKNIQLNIFENQPPQPIPPIIKPEVKTPPINTESKETNYLEEISNLFKAFCKNTGKEIVSSATEIYDSYKKIYDALETEKRMHAPKRSPYELQTLISYHKPPFLYKDSSLNWYKFVKNNEAALKRIVKKQKENYPLPKPIKE